MRLDGLSRKIMIWMASITAGASLLVTLANYGFYYLWEHYSPASFKAIGDVPAGWEIVWILITTGICLFVAGYFGNRLAKRILEPLNSVTGAIKKVVAGDLSARAQFGHFSLGEANALVNDFNHLAKKLEHVAELQKFRNAAIVHELRTPLVILSLRLQGLRDGVYEKTSDNLNVLLSQIKRLSQLLTGLRTVGLADAGHLPLQWSEVNLKAEVQATIDFFAERFLASGHIPVLYGHSGSVWCDPMHIRQALLALFENVHRHADKGLVTIRMRNDEFDGYELAVEDQGPGVPEDLAPYIFQAFQYSARKGNTSSSGLGLAVVDAIAKAHHGEAKYERLPSGGARFFINWKKQ